MNLLQFELMLLKKIYKIRENKFLYYKNNHNKIVKISLLNMLFEKFLTRQLRNDHSTQRKE